MILELFWGAGLCWGSQQGHLLKSLVSWTCTSASMAPATNLAQPLIHFTHSKQDGTNAKEKPGTPNGPPSDTNARLMNGKKLSGYMATWLKRGICWWLAFPSVLAWVQRSQIRFKVSITDEETTCSEHEVSCFNNFWALSHMHPKSCYHIVA